MSWDVSESQILCYDLSPIPILAPLQPTRFILLLLKKRFNRIQPTVPVRFFSIFIFQRLPAVLSSYDRDHFSLLGQSAGHLGHLPFPDMSELDQQIADEIRDWAEPPPCPHCGAALRRGMPHKFCCQRFAHRISVNPPRPIDEQLLDRIVQFAYSHSTFPSILNCNSQPVLQHGCVSSLIASDSNLFISGILCALDSYRQFTTPLYAVFLRTHPRIAILPGDTEEILAFILSKQNVPVPSPKSVRF
jgi:hypothetical protein